MKRDRQAAAAPPEERRTRSRAEDGQIAAQVFELLGQGKNKRQIVKQLQITPRRAKQLYREWVEPDFAIEEAKRKDARAQLVIERRRAKEDAELERTLAKAARTQTGPAEEES